MCLFVGWLVLGANQKLNGGLTEELLLAVAAFVPGADFFVVSRWIGSLFPRPVSWGMHEAPFDQGSEGKRLPVPDKGYEPKSLLSLAARSWTPG